MEIMFVSKIIHKIRYAGILWMGGFVLLGLVLSSCALYKAEHTTLLVLAIRSPQGNTVHYVYEYGNTLTSCVSSLHVTNINNQVFIGKAWVTVAQDYAKQHRQNSQDRHAMMITNAQRFLFVIGNTINSSVHSKKIPFNSIKNKNETYTLGCIKDHVVYNAKKHPYAAYSIQWIDKNSPTSPTSPTTNPTIIPFANKQQCVQKYGSKTCYRYINSSTSFVDKTVQGYTVHQPYHKVTLIRKSLPFQTSRKTLVSVQKYYITSSLQECETKIIKNKNQEEGFNKKIPLCISAMNFELSPRVIQVNQRQTWVYGPTGTPQALAYNGPSTKPFLVFYVQYKNHHITQLIKYQQNKFCVRSFGASNCYYLTNNKKLANNIFQ